MKHGISVLTLFVSLISMPHLFAQEDTQSFVRGDSNVSGSVDLSDSLHVLGSLFVFTDPLPCQDATDANDDGRINISDAIHLLRYLFQGGPAPEAPFMDCGFDETEDNLACTEFPFCDVIDPTCIDDSQLEGLLGDPIPGISFCIPSGLLDLPLSDDLSISVCPEDEAEPCGIGDLNGCEITIESIRPIYDPEQTALLIRIEGRIENLPIRVATSGIFATETTCTSTFHGEDGEDTPFSFDLATVLLTDQNAAGDLDIVGIEIGEITNVNIEMSSSGGLLCGLFDAAQELVIGLFVTTIEELIAGVIGEAVEQFGQNLVGISICQ